MQRKVFQLIVDNTAGVLSRISGLFSRRGYNIESITAGVTSDQRFTRITIVTSGDEAILNQIEKQVAKLVDVRDVRELRPNSSVYRELVLVKIKVSDDKRQAIVSVADIFRAKIVDVDKDSMIIEITGNQAKTEAFLDLLKDYEVVQIARTGIAGLARGLDDMINVKDL